MAGALSVVHTLVPYVAERIQLADTALTARYDRRESFEHLERWLHECHQNAQNENIEIMVVGMKCDLSTRCVSALTRTTLRLCGRAPWDSADVAPCGRSERQVTEDEGRAWAHAHGLYFIEASAKTAVNVEQAFSQTAATILANFDYVNHQVRKGSGVARISLEQQQTRSAAKSDCCSL